MDFSCRQLAVEGERLMKAHDYEHAIEMFEAGLRAGTDQNDVLSAIYNQLGNACFYVGKYDKALEYHKKDLDIAQKIGDRQGMAKAYGNLGNTFKALRNYTNAQRCCEQHLHITQQLKDRLGEGRACYNLGNVHHAVGKARMALRTPQDAEEGRKAVLVAVDYYKKALAITVELQDIAGEGRAVGNLGNAYTAIGDFNEAIQYHSRRLKIAQDTNDLPGRARACGNLGNAYSALGDFTEAIKYYQQTLGIAKETNSPQGQAQAYYCLASSFWQQKNAAKAIENFNQYLEIGTAMDDKPIQMRAWHNLRNIYLAQNDIPKGQHYHDLLQAAQGLPPSVVPQLPRPGQPMQSRQPTVTIPQAPGKTYIPPSANKQPKKKVDDKGGLLKGLFKSGPKTEFAMPFRDEDDEDDNEDDDGGVVRTRKIGAVKGGPNANGSNSSVASPATRSISSSMSSPIAGNNNNNNNGQSTPSNGSAGGVAADDWLNDAIKEVGAQPASQRPPPGGHGDEMDFFDMLLSSQTSRLDDQRSAAPSVGGSQSVPMPISDFGLADEDFFDMLMEKQHTRIDEQRSPAPSTFKQPDTPNDKKLPPALDDNMSFFEMLAVMKAKPSHS